MSRYQLVIGSKNLSSWSLRPWLAMRRLGIDFDEVLINLRQPDSPARIAEQSPSRKVPALKAGGQVVWDSLAILEFLAEERPELWPADRTARAIARSVAAEMHSGFAALREHCPMDFVARLPRSEFPAPVEADIRRVIEIWRDCRARCGASGPFLFGAFSAADAMYAPVASRFRTYVSELAPFGDDGTAAAYVETLFGMPEMTLWADGARKETTGS